MRKIIQNNINPDIKLVYSENDSLSIIFQSNELLSNIVGEFNNNIKELEVVTGTNIYTRGNSISVRGSTEKNETIKMSLALG